MGLDWDGYGMGMGWDLCVGLFYEHRFAMLISTYVILNKYAISMKYLICMQMQTCLLTFDWEIRPPEGRGRIQGIGR